MTPTVQRARNDGARTAPNRWPIGAQGSGVGSPEQPVNSSIRPWVIESEGGRQLRRPPNCVCLLSFLMISRSATCRACSVRDFAPSTEWMAAITCPDSDRMERAICRCSFLAGPGGMVRECFMITRRSS